MQLWFLSIGPISFWYILLWEKAQWLYLFIKASEFIKISIFSLLWCSEFYWDIKIFHLAYWVYHRERSLHFVNILGKSINYNLHVYVRYIEAKCAFLLLFFFCSFMRWFCNVHIMLDSSFIKHFTCSTVLQFMSSQ